MPERADRRCIPKPSNPSSRSLLVRGEATKLLENTFRGVNTPWSTSSKWSMAAMGIDVWKSFEPRSNQPVWVHSVLPRTRPGRTLHPHRPFYLTCEGAGIWPAHSVSSNLAGEVQHGNAEYVVHRVAEALNCRAQALNGSRNSGGWVAYKPNVDDARESPSLILMRPLLKSGARG